MRKPRIAIFDYYVRSSSAPGGCHLYMLRGLAEKYDFTVFAVEFDNPDPSRIGYVHIPAPRKPTFLLTTVFQLLAPLYFLLYRLRGGAPFDCIQRLEVCTAMGSIAYAHFCHRAYLKNHWRYSRPHGIHRFLWWLDHAVRAYILEPLLYRRARTIVVPSQGLARELAQCYPDTKAKIYLLPNSADYDRLAHRALGFDRKATRALYGFSEEDLVIVFIALGQFERKGLPQLMEAISHNTVDRVKLLVVGGSQYWIEQYAEFAQRLKVTSRVVFGGIHAEVAPLLWAADIFALPSFYETFSLVALEAAAAGRAILITRLNGVEDYIRDRVNGIYVEATADSIATGIQEMIVLGPAGREALGNAAQRSAAAYSRSAFISNWDHFFATHAGVDKMTLDVPPGEWAL